MGVIVESRTIGFVMKTAGVAAFMFFVLSVFARAGVCHALSGIDPGDLSWIGRTIFQNECGGNTKNLVSWNKGEHFPSLGIGHFIWYPRGMEGPFEESFTAFLDFVRQRGVLLPDFIRAMKTVDCPWPNRREFLKSRRTPAMEQLHRFLVNTTHEQTLFIVARFENAIPKMLEAAASDKKHHVERQLDRIAGSSRQLYALIDYVNFKGEGLRQSERYNNQGWGLLQVLEEMRGHEPGPLAIHDFIHAAEAVLARRVANAPYWKNEHRWLPGWKNRIGDYRRLASMS